MGNAVPSTCFQKGLLIFFEISEILVVPSERSSQTVNERLVDAEIFAKSIFGQKASVESIRIRIRDPLVLLVVYNHRVLPFLIFYSI